MKVTIGHMYPDLLNLYGDRGNIRTLEKRLEWRGMESRVIPVNMGDPLPWDQFDIVLLGGGSDREQKLVCEELVKNRREFREYVESGGVLIAICGGYQLLGSYYQIGDTKVPGLELVDMVTNQDQGRLIGNISIQSDLVKTPVTGFENHGGRTVLSKDAKPFGRVLSGHGNTDDGGYEGVQYKNVIGTYLHGPLLPKNPELADLLLLRALKRKYGDSVTLSSLDDSAENRANEYMRKRMGLR